MNRNLNIKMKSFLKLFKINETKAFMYWNITPARMNVVLKNQPQLKKTCKICVRLYDITNPMAKTYQQITTAPTTKSQRFSNLLPNHCYYAQLGLYHNNVFYPLLLSNEIVTSNHKHTQMTLHAAQKEATQDINIDDSILLFSLSSYNNNPCGKC
ncbi:DUF4912 domain-containing protein [Hazenella sp. IB182357]|uniref:DUF4912 domain-containing protein n=1 Tax=Polycladospora coralii TaxID=2771432 RepID=A0A926N6A2_9BACL|nr:DUF4912 domain-containing protein [Polycladospora coralii]MBD1372649.1 DUF4912 domain-containing protein [Polycladospora coralii]MBS7531243.1 DUF4912 domain-containing protein [Polycladospora coralii]